MMVSSLLSVFGVISLKFGLIDDKISTSAVNEKRKTEVVSDNLTYPLAFSSTESLSSETFYWEVIETQPILISEVNQGLTHEKQENINSKASLSQTTGTKKLSPISLTQAGNSLSGNDGSKAVFAGLTSPTRANNAIRSSGN